MLPSSLWQPQETARLPKLVSFLSQYFYWGPPQYKPVLVELSPQVPQFALEPCDVGECLVELGLKVSALPGVLRCSALELSLRRRPALLEGPSLLLRTRLQLATTTTVVARHGPPASNNNRCVLCTGLQLATTATVVAPHGLAASNNNNRCCSARACS